MKKLLTWLLVGTLAIVCITACATKQNVDSENNSTIRAKIAINIEGVVTEIHGNRITLDNGQTVIISEKTLFETENVGNFVAVDKNIQVGNYIQGFTFGDEKADVVIADVISSNGVLEMSMRSVMVNIEGIIVEVSEDGKRFKLNTGKWVVVTENTELGITSPNAAPKEKQYFEPTFRIGNSIAGFTLDESTDTLIAYAIYTNWNWENPIR